MSVAEKLTTIAENEQKVFDSGYAKGKQAEYDAFWDKYQQNGKRTDYGNAFSGKGWTDETFKPKYNLILGNGNASNMFLACLITDLSALLEQQGIIFDTQNYNPPSYDYIDTFRNSYDFTRVPVLHVPERLRLHYTYYYCQKLHTIDGLILSEEGNQTFDVSTFSNCNELQNITITGKIGQNGFDIHWSKKLTKASITSIINALLDTAEGKTVTFSKTAVNKAFETSEGANNGSTSDEWIALITPKSNAYNGNWTIALS